MFCVIICGTQILGRVVGECPLPKFVLINFPFFLFSVGMVCVDYFSRAGQLEFLHTVRVNLSVTAIVYYKLRLLYDSQSMYRIQLL